MSSVIGTCDGHKIQNGLTGFFSFFRFLSDPVFSFFWATFSSLPNKYCFSRCHKLVVLEYRRCQTASVNQLSFTKYFLDVSTTEQLNVSQMFMFFFLKKTCTWTQFSNRKLIVDPTIKTYTIIWNLRKVVCTNAVLSG